MSVTEPRAMSSLVSRPAVGGVPRVSAARSAASAAVSSRSTAGLVTTASTEASITGSGSDSSGLPLPSRQHAPGGSAGSLAADRTRRARARPDSGHYRPLGPETTRARTGRPLRRRRRGRLAAGGRPNDFDDVTGPAAQDVAQRGQGGQAQPLRAMPVTSPYTCSRDSVIRRSASSGPSCVVAYMSFSAISRREMPPVTDRCWHHVASCTASKARASAARSIRFLASCPTVNGTVRY